MEHPIIVARSNFSYLPTFHKTLAEALDKTHDQKHVYVATWNDSFGAYAWQSLAEARRSVAQTTVPTAHTPVPVPAETLKSVLGNCNQNTAELEARIKKLQEKVEFLTANDKVHTETIAAMTVSMGQRLGDLEKKAVIAAQLEAKTEKGLLLLEGDIGRRTQELSERVSQLESNTEMECAPWCTKQGHHTVCSPAPQVWPSPTPAAAVTSAGNPGEATDCKTTPPQPYYTSAACQCDLTVRHYHKDRHWTAVCYAGCILKSPHTGRGCTVLL